MEHALTWEEWIDVIATLRAHNERDLAEKLERWFAQNPPF